MVMDQFPRGLLRDKAGEGSDGSSGKAAEKAEENEEAEETEEEETEENDEESEEEDEEAGEEAEPKLGEAQQKEANSIYKLLADPATQKSTLEILAKQAGLLGTQDTKKEVKEDAETLVKILEDSLGENLKWLAPKLAPALEKMLGKEREASTKTLSDLKNQQVVKEVSDAYETLAKETKGLSRKFESKMVKLADEIYPAPGMSVVKYVRTLYTLASAEGTAKLSKEQLAEKINRNSKDAPGRLTNSSTSAGGKGRDSSVRVSLKDAVRQAAAKQGYKGD
jgi:hypothetical protein